MVQTNGWMHVSTLMHSDIPLKAGTFVERVSNYHLHEKELVPRTYESLAVLYKLVTMIFLIPAPCIRHYLQCDQRVHNYIKHNNYKQHAPTCFDI